MDSNIAAALVGAGAVLGGVSLTIGGSLLTEKVRAGREKDARLHDVRQDVYSRFMSNADRLANWTSTLASYPDLAPGEVYDFGGPVDLDEWVEAQTRLVAEVSLIGHPDVVSAAMDVTYTLYEWADNRIEHQDGELLDPGAPVAAAASEDSEDPETRRALGEARENQDSDGYMRSAFLAANKRCIDAMRRDLGALRIG